jgi:hypothetical protein
METSAFDHPKICAASVLLRDADNRYLVEHVLCLTHVCVEKVFLVELRLSYLHFSLGLLQVKGGIIVSDDEINQNWNE